MLTLPLSGQRVATGEMLFIHERKLLPCSRGAAGDQRAGRVLGLGDTSDPNW